jgi:hypothetical protein
VKKTGLRIRDSLILSIALVAAMLSGCAQSTTPAREQSSDNGSTTSGSTSETTSSGTPTGTSSASFAITSPAAGSTIAASTFTVSGTYSADTAPTSVTVYFGTSSYSATVDSTAKTWTVEVATPYVAAGTGKQLKAVATWAGITKTATIAYDYTETSVTGYSISGTVSFPSGAAIPSGNLYIYAIPENIDNPVASTTVTLGTATYYTYKFTGIPNGYYTIRAYTCAAGTTTYVAGTSYYHFDGFTFLMDNADHAVPGSFILRNPSTAGPTMDARSFSVTYPLASDVINDGTFVAYGKWTGEKEPATIVIQFGASAETTNATVNADGTWSATIKASTYLTSTGNKSFYPKATWTYSIPGSTTLTILHEKMSCQIQYSGPVK